MFFEKSHFWGLYKTFGVLGWNIIFQWDLVLNKNALFVRKQLAAILFHYLVLSHHVDLVTSHGHISPNILKSNTPKQNLYQHSAKQNLYYIIVIYIYFLNSNQNFLFYFWKKIGGGGSLYFSKMSQFQLFDSLICNITFIRNVWNSKMSQFAQRGGPHFSKMSEM